MPIISTNKSIKRQSRRTLHSTSPHLNLTYLSFAIPLMATTGITVLGISFINHNPEDFASATTATVSSTLSYRDEYITVSNPSVIDLSSNDLNANTTYVYATNDITVSTNVPTGYELYLTSSNKTSAALTSTDSNNSTTIPTTSGTGGETGTPKTLDQDSYGYAVASDVIGNTKFDSSYTNPTSSSKFAAIPTGASDRIRSHSSATTGETTSVHYGINVTNALAPGQYTGQVTYSVVATPTKDTIAMTVSPNATFTTGAGTTVTITSGPTNINTASNLSADEVDIYFRQNNVIKGTCTINTVKVANTGITTTCTAPALSTGTYDIYIKIPRYGFKDIKSNAYRVYTNTLKNRVEHNNITTLQGLTSSVCSAANTWSSTSEDFTLKDSRDNNTYYIRKLKDGHCWMVQNLRLGSTSAMTLTSDSSNVTSDYSLPASKSGNSWISTYTSAYMHVGATSDSTNWKTTYGNYYNWVAATAGSSSSSGSSSTSICPKRWVLPNGGNNAASPSYYYLYNTSYGANKSNFMAAANTSSDYWAGQYGGSISGIGSGGYWWSGTAAGFGNAYNLYISSNTIDFDNSSNYSKGRGYSVRCVLSDS